MSQEQGADDHSLVGTMVRPVPPREAMSYRKLTLASWLLTLMLHTLGVVLFVWLASHPGSVLRSISKSSSPELVRATLLSGHWRSAHSDITKSKISAKSKALDVAVKPSTSRKTSSASELPALVASKPKTSHISPRLQRREPTPVRHPSSPVRTSVRRMANDAPPTPASMAIPVLQPAATASASKEKDTKQSVTQQSDASTKKVDLDPEASAASIEPGGPIITQARYRGTPIPEEYPLMARRRGWQGTVMVEVWLDASGEQLKREILQSSGYALLDQAALRSVARNQFTPYTINGVGHPARLHLPVIYTLSTQ